MTLLFLISSYFLGVVLKILLFFQLFIRSSGGRREASLATPSLIDFAEDENAELVTVFAEKNNLRKIWFITFRFKTISYRHGFGTQIWCQLLRREIPFSPSKCIASSRCSDSNVACWRRSPKQAGFILFSPLILSCAAKRNAFGRRSRKRKGILLEGRR